MQESALVRRKTSLCAERNSNTGYNRTREVTVATTITIIIPGYFRHHLRHLSEKISRITSISCEYASRTPCRRDYFKTTLELIFEGLIQLADQLINSMKDIGPGKNPRVMVELNSRSPYSQLLLSVQRDHLFLTTIATMDKNTCNNG